MIVAAGTVLSSLLSARLSSGLGSPLSLLSAFSYGPGPTWFFLFSQLHLPLSIGGTPRPGAGCVDAALNNYVALHYQARHMNWLHCFWGVGAAIGPIIMSKDPALGESWTQGYSTVGWAQIALVVILFLSIPFRVNNQEVPGEEAGTNPTPTKNYWLFPA